MGRSIVWGSSVAAVVLAACGPEIVETAEFEEACGDAGPVQLLQLSASERVVLSGGSVAAAGDRVLVVVGEYAQAPAGDATLPDARAHRIVSVDACGDDPRPVAEGLTTLLPPVAEGDPWLACNSGTRELAVIDPTGEAEPVLLSEGAGCGAHVGAGGRWFIEELDGGRRDLVRADAGGLTTFAEDVVWAVWGSDETVVLYSTSDLTLWELDLASMEAVAIAEDVGVFALAGDDRFVVSMRETDRLAEGPWTVLDRETGTEVSDLRGKLRHSANGVVVGDDEQLTHVELPSLTRSVIDGWWNVHGITLEGALVLHDPTDEWLYLAQPGRSEPELLHAGRVIDSRLDGDHLLAWEYDWDPASEDASQTTARLLRIPVDGGPFETIVDDVHQPLGLTDGRWVSVRDQDATQRGDLWVVDPETDDARLVDRGVDLHFARLSGSAHMFPTEGLQPADEPFFYTIHEASDRNGLWSATLAPR